MKTTHLSGTTVVIGRRVIQRCLVCGYKLVDVDLNRVAVVNTRENDNSISSFPIGHLIQVSGTNPIESINLGETERPVFETPWEDCCIDLVEE